MVRPKRWYAIQTYAGSELKVKEELENRVGHLNLQEKLERFDTNGKAHFLVPVEEVITSKSRSGRAGEYRVPYNYELAIQSNERIEKDDLIARKPPRYIEHESRVLSIESFQRVIVEMTNRNEEEYLIPQDKKIRRGIRKGEKIRGGVPLTEDQEVTLSVSGRILKRDNVKKIKLEQVSDGEIKTEVIPNQYLVKLREGMKLKEGDLLEKEDKIISSVAGMTKIKEYKDKRLVTVQQIEKRRLFPGYIFGKMVMDEGVLELVEGLNCQFVGSPPQPITGDEIKVVKRKAGLMEEPKPERPKIEVDFDVGEVVKVVEGPFADFTGEVKEIDKEKEEVTVMVKIFGRETPVKLGFEGIEKV